MAEGHRKIFDTEIRPFLFDGIPPGAPEPTFTVLVGQPGAGRSRAVGRLIAESAGDVVPLRATDLQLFLTDPRDRSPIREWMRLALEHARRHRISLALEDTFQTPEAARAAINTFAHAGYRTQVVVVAVSRAESLLAATARQLRSPRAGQGELSAVADAVEAGIQAVNQLVHTAAAENPTTVVRILTRDGAASPALTPGDDAARVADSGAIQQLAEARRAPLPGRVAAEWISELRRITEAPQGSARALLAELHRIALREVLPNLPVPEGSAVHVQLDTRLTRELLALEGGIALEPARTSAAPVRRGGPETP